MPSVTMNVVSPDDLMEIVGEMQALDVLAEDDENLSPFLDMISSDDQVIAAGKEFEDKLDAMLQDWLPSRLRDMDGEIVIFEEELESVVYSREQAAALAGYRKGIEECLEIVTKRLGDPFAD